MTSEEAYAATCGPHYTLLMLILARLDALDGGVAPPVAPLALTSLQPTSAVVGDPSFTLHALGTGFTHEAVMVCADTEVPTTVVSSTALTTFVDMSGWQAAAPAAVVAGATPDKPPAPQDVLIPVRVRSGTTESNTLVFAMQSAAKESQ